MTATLTLEAAPPQTQPCCGLDSLVETLGGNRGVAVKLAQLFLESYREQLARLNKAAGERDLPAVKRAAHDIRGSCAVFAAEYCLGVARKIEMDLGEQRLEEWEVDCRRLNQALEAVAAELTAFVDNPAGI